MIPRSLLKGFEVELFTGKKNGQHVGVASSVVDDLTGFVKEPDQRNLEYITIPFREYDSLKEALLSPRRKLRSWLASRELTLLPGSTLSLGNSKEFQRSDQDNPYHDFIEASYGTTVVTASVHINLGVDNFSQLFSALRLVRCEASLLLALSASSPFLDGSVTGAHSQRWLQFPRTPSNVPLFLNHSEYVTWVEKHLASGAMTNERHLWTSVRPNGSNRPYELNRLEVRICDLITNTELLLAVTTLLELRVLNLFNDPQQLDPLNASKLSMSKLAEISDSNELEVAQNSLEANLKHWLDGKSIVCREWIMQLIEEVTPLAKEMNIQNQLEPLFSILEKGNQSMRWISEHNQGDSIESILQRSINDMQSEELLASTNKVILG